MNSAFVIKLDLDLSFRKSDIKQDRDSDSDADMN